MTANDLSELGGHEFESLIEQLVQKMGFITEERKLTTDGGIDILAVSHEPMFKGKYVIQCKRYSSPVGEPILRDLYGVVHSENANKGILITNSGFTKAAIDFAKDKQLELIDGGKLLGLLSEYEITESKKKTIKLSDQTRFLINSFAPAMNKVRDQVNEIRNQRVYLEKRNLSSSQWNNLCNTTSVRINEYYVFLKRIFTELDTTVEANTKKTKDACDNLLKATKKIAKHYRDLSSVIPPAEAKIVHQKCLNVYVKMFESWFQFADSIERIGTLPNSQLTESREYNIESRKYDVVFERNPIDNAIRELNDALDSYKKREGCFIATAVYGSPLAKEINVLHDFRDNVLERSSLGKKAVVLYYQISPYLVPLIEESNTRKKVIRIVLDSLINHFKEHF